MKTGGEGSRAALAVMAGAALLGLAPIWVRLSELGPQATAFWRFAVALPILVGFALRSGPAPSRGAIWLLLLGGAAFGLDIGLWSEALGHTTVTNSTLLSNMTPIFAAAAGWVLWRERVSAAVLAGGGAALAGAVVLTLARAQSGEGPATSAADGLYGDGLALFSAFWYAVYLLIVRALRGRVAIGWIMGLACFGSVVFAALATWVTGESFWPRTLEGWAILVCLGIVVQVGGQGLIAYGLGHLPIAVSTILLWIQPLAAAVLSWILFGEELGPLALAGAALILGGVWVVQRARSV